MLEDNEQPEDDDEDEEKPAFTPPLVPTEPKVTADQLLIDGKPDEPKDKKLDGTSEEGEADPVAKLTMTELLNHPKLGPAIQSWADTSGNARLEATKREVRAELEQELEFSKLESEFKDMTREDWAELVSEDPSAVERYGQYKSILKMREGSQSDAKIAESAETFAMMAQIKTYQELLKGAGLPDDKLALLDPAHFTLRQDGSPAGRQGIINWGTAIYSALVEAEVERRLETRSQEHLAELDAKGTRKSPVLANGQTRGAIRLSKEVLKNMTPEEINKIPEDELDRVLMAP